jgi:hypothetical protein
MIVFAAMLLVVALLQQGAEGLNMVYVWFAASPQTTHTPHNQYLCTSL